MDTWTIYNFFDVEVERCRELDTVSAAKDAYVDGDIDIFQLENVLEETLETER